jgi:tetratricopeptide (TPR) repeat protein
LTCKELSIVLALRVGNTRINDADEFIDPEEEVLRLCCPYARVSQNHAHLMHESVKDFLILPSSRPGFSIHITNDESDAYLARKCLVALSLEEYRSPSTIAILLRRNVASAAEQDEDKYFYQYAATHWHVHLIALSDPPMDLVQQVTRFLEGNEFASWSEYIFQLSGSQGTIVEVQGKLKIWRDDLSQDLKDCLLLENYFVGPYRAVAKYFGDDGGDKTLPYICLFQLGEFFNLSDRLKEAFEVKKTVAEGLVGLLGENHPLALKAESAYALEYLGQGRFREAEELFGRLAEIQRKELGTDRPDYYQSLQRQGMAEIWMTKYIEADLNLTESLSGFIRTVGPTHFLYLLSQQSLGCVLEGQGELRRATLEYEHVWRYRMSVLGPDNPMAIWSRCALVSTYRKLGRLEDAEKAIKEVIDSRTRTIGTTAESTVDAMIQRVVLLRESDKGAEAMELIDFISDGGLVEPWFERVCQVDHIRALLENDSGNVELARVILQSLLDQALERGVEGRNRTLLWVRLDLALILRRQRRDNEALMLFDDIITSIDSESNSSWEEPQTPAELRIAEKALRLVREIKTQDAEKLLGKKGFRWVRQEDFWMLAGGPAADTAWMKEPLI